MDLVDKGIEKLLPAVRIYNGNRSLKIFEVRHMIESISPTQCRQRSTPGS